MNLKQKLGLIALAIALPLALTATAADDLVSNFMSPPDSARPWVYWF